MRIAHLVIRLACGLKHPAKGQVDQYGVMLGLCELKARQDSPHYQVAITLGLPASIATIQGVTLAARRRHGREQQQ